MRTLVLATIVAGASAASCAARHPPQGQVASPGPADPVRGLPGSPGAQTKVPREYLVTVEPGAGEAAVRDVFGRLGITRVQARGGDVFLVTFGEDPGLDALEAARQGDARIRAVQPNFVYRSS